MYAAFCTLIRALNPSICREPSALHPLLQDYLGATIQVAELAAYCALLADWGVLASGSAAAWQPLALLAGVVVLPVLYSRRIVDFNKGGDC